MTGRLTIVAAGAALLAGCATAPDRVVADAVDASAYHGRSCVELRGDRETVEASLRSADRAQKRTRIADGVGMALVFLPVGRLTGHDHAREIATLKGERAAIAEATVHAGCS